MPVDLEQMNRRLESVEQGIRELLRRVLDLEEKLAERQERRTVNQTTTVDWWQTWDREEEK